MNKSLIKAFCFVLLGIPLLATKSVYSGVAPECLNQDAIWGYNGQSCLGGLMPLCPAGLGGSGNVRWDAGNNRQCRFSTSSNNTGGASNNVSSQNMSSSQNIYGNPNDITDIIVTMGQSNAVGYASRNNYDGGTQDAAHPRVYVWAKDVPTSQYRWLIANVRNQDVQKWIANGSFGGINNGTQEGQSHGGYQIAKRIASDQNRVVGIIPTGANGQPISFWNSGNYYNNSVVGHINNARGALNSPPKVGLVWWMQGEADNPSDLNGANTYYNRLTSLISRLSSNSQFWDKNNTLFVANHIGTVNNNTQINLAFDRLNSDNNNNARTCSNSLRNLVRVDNAHFSAATLGRIGVDVGNKYLNPNSCESGSGTTSTGGQTLVACKWGGSTFPICPASVTNYDSQGFGWSGSSCVRNDACGPESWKTKIYQ